MFIDSTLLILGYALIFMSSWPAMHFVKTRQFAHLPANFRLSLNVSMVLAGIGILGLVVAVFVPGLSFIAVVVAFFLGGPFGGQLGLRYASTSGNYLVLHAIGLVGLGIFVTAFFRALTAASI